MTQMIQTLHNVVTDKTDKWITITSTYAEESNTYTAEDVALIKERGWKAYSYDKDNNVNIAIK